MGIFIAGLGVICLAGKNLNTTKGSSIFDYGNSYWHSNLSIGVLTNAMNEARNSFGLLRDSVYAAVPLTAVSYAIFVLNVLWDDSMIAFAATFDNFQGYSFAPYSLLIAVWYMAIFSTLCALGYAVQDKLGQRLETDRQVNIALIIGPVITLFLLRSMIMEPFLYQTFYSTVPAFRYFMNGLLHYDIKPLIDFLLIAYAGATAWILIKRYTIIFGLVLMAICFSLPTHYLNWPGKNQNEETIIFILADSLRKDVIENNPDLFISNIYNQSIIFENMYTVFPASVPALASVISGDYPYKFRATAVSLDKPLDLNLFNELKKKYLISLHTDFTDDDIVNRQNFSIPFDYVESPVINNSTIVNATVIKKNPVLLAFINNETIRNILIPAYYQSDSNSNSRHSADSALDFLRAHKQAKKVVFLSFGNSHLPFEAKYPYYREFLPHNQEGQFNWIFDYSNYLYQGESPHDNQNVRNLYQASVRDLDNEFKYFFDSAKRSGVLDNATLIITSDQGENLFDNNLNLYSHNNLDTRHVINVPFAVFRTGGDRQSIKDNYALSDALQIAINTGDIGAFAREYVYIESDLDVHNPGSRLFVGNVGHVIDSQSLNNMSITDMDYLHKYKRRAVIYSDYILISSPEEELRYKLYNLDKDPLFQSDLSDSHPRVHAVMSNKLEEFILDAKSY